MSLSKYKKKLVVIGDSFCHGHGTVSQFEDKRNTEFAFGKYIADHFDLQYVNLAQPASDIQKIIKNGYEYIKKNKNDIQLLIIGWTSGDRLGFYDNDNAFKILAQYCELGENINDENIAVDYKYGIKFVSDKKNEKHLKNLSSIYKIFLDNNFFQYSKNLAEINAVLFKNWLDTEKINYLDFCCFGNVDIKTKCPVTFNHVCKFLDTHPTKEEQKAMAKLLIDYIK